MAKKRPTLDAFLTSQADTEQASQQNSSYRQELAKAAPIDEGAVVPTKGNKNAFKALQRAEKPEIIRHMLYLPLPVYDQLHELIFEEQRGQAKRRKTHDYLLDAIDLLFKEKGLKSISELMSKK